MNSVKIEVVGQVRSLVVHQVETLVWGEGGGFRFQVRDKIRSQVWDQVWIQVWRKAWGQVLEEL